VTATDLIRRAEKAGATLTPNGDKLRVTPSRPIPAALVEALRAHKRQILAELTRPPEIRLAAATYPPPAPPAPACTPEAERAAIQAEAAEALPTPEEVLDWPLTEVDRRRVRLKIRSRLLGTDLWLIPSGDPGPSDGLPTYSTDEVRELLKLSPSDLADSIQRIHLARLSFGPAATVGEVTHP